MTNRFSQSVVGVVLGGMSREREVSLNTGRAVIGALKRKGYRVVEIDANRELDRQLRTNQIDVVFNALHGTFGEDGRVQGMLDWMAIPYTGEGQRASVLGFDKALAKSLYRSAGVPVAREMIVPGEALFKFDLNALPFSLPAVVKPVAEGSSVGINLVQDAEQMPEALQAASGMDVMIEEFIEGPECSVVCLGEDVLGSVEIAASRAFYDYEAKYGEAGTQYFVPPRWSDSDIEAAEAVGLGAHRALGCRSVTRTDVILGADGPIALETNTLPGMTASSLVPKVAAAIGISFDDLIERILNLATFGPSDRGAV